MLIQRIAQFNRGRDPERLALKYKAMQKDALAFFRGTCHLFCDAWPQGHRLNDVPVVWVCGDLHVENFGSYKGDNRLVYFDIADFDEAVLAPCAWDLTRLLTSGLLAARTRGLKHKQGLALSQLCLDAYLWALRDGKARWVEGATAAGPIRKLFAQLEKTTQQAFLRKRTTVESAYRKLRIDGKHTLPVGDADRRRVKHFMKAFAADQARPEFFKMLDVAKRIAGTGSLGLERYSILIDGRGSPAGHFLLDLKYASGSALAPYVQTKQPKWRDDADRIVAVQKRMQAIAPALLQPVRFNSRPFVLRELMPSQDKLDLKPSDISLDDFEGLAKDLGALLAWSELRSGGRNGSATTDDLIRFAANRKSHRYILSYAENYQEIAWRDWKRFREAYRDGGLDIEDRS